MKYIFIALLTASNLFLGVNTLAAEKTPHTIKQFIYPRFTCEENGKKDCFNLTLNAIEKRYSSIDEDKFTRPHTFSTSSVKPEYVFIYIHGLWTDSEQLESVGSKLYYKVSPSSSHIRLVLPGHGNDKINHKQVGYQHWLQSVRNAIYTSKLLGKKTILVGQSTGGLLATYMALENPKDIAGLILFEPALQLRDGIAQAVCVAPLLAPKIFQMFPEYKKNLRPPESLQFGCEVLKLQMQMLKRFYNDDSIIGQLKRVSYKATLKNVFSQIKTPVFLYNNPKDQIVSTSVNRLFAKTVRGPIYSTELSPQTVYEKIEDYKQLEKSHNAEVDKILENIKFDRATKARTHGNSNDFNDAIRTKKFRDFFEKSLKIKFN